MSKIKNGGLDQYGAEPFEPQQFGTAGVKGVKQIEYLTVTCFMDVFKGWKPSSDRWTDGPHR